MNKAELISKIVEQHELKKSEARRYVNLLFYSIIDTLAKGERVEIRGLCAINVKTYKSYTGRNPKTGEVVGVKPKRLPFFKSGAELKERVDR